MASPAERSVAAALLASNRLPIEDLDAEPHVELHVARDRDRVIGVIGLARYGSMGLLRSLAVAADHRGQGLGGRLVAHLEQRAIERGFGELFLLTETAAALFERHGYRRIERDRVPAELRTSAEFRSLCPATAICFVKGLPGATPE